MREPVFKLVRGQLLWLGWRMRMGRTYLSTGVDLREVLFGHLLVIVKVDELELVLRSRIGVQCRRDLEAEADHEGVEGEGEVMERVGSVWGRHGWLSELSLPGELS